MKYPVGIPVRVTVPPYNGEIMQLLQHKRIGLYDTILVDLEGTRRGFNYTEFERIDVEIDEEVFWK